MQINANKKRNDLVDLMRIVAALMVLAIHTHPGEEIGETAYLIMSNIIPRLGVPFFFSIAGYYYIKALLEGTANFKRTISRLLYIYIFWSLLYIAFKLAYAVYIDAFYLKSFLLDVVESFFIRGSFYHLWYFPALFICICFATFFHKLGGLKLGYLLSVITFLLGLSITSYYGIASNIGAIKWLVEETDFILIRRMFFMNITYFMSGYLLYQLTKIKLKLQTKHYIIVIGVIAILELLEIYITRKTGISKTFLLTFFQYPLLLSINLMLLNSNVTLWQAKKYKRISTYTYFIHPLFIPLIRDYFDLTPTILYFTMVVVLLVSGYFVSGLKHKVFKRIL